MPRPHRTPCPARSSPSLRRRRRHASRSWSRRPARWRGGTAACRCGGRGLPGRPEVWRGACHRQRIKVLWQSRISRPAPAPLQEEIAAKAARLQRVAAATETARQQAAGLAAECQAERERLLEDIRRLNTQMKQKAGAPLPVWLVPCMPRGWLLRWPVTPPAPLVPARTASPIPPWPWSHGPQPSPPAPLRCPACRTWSSPPSSPPSTSS